MTGPAILLWLADLVLALHFATVLFVVIGQLAILAGWLGGWAWTRNVLFRAIHLLLIVFVMVEDWLQVACPLTVAERELRRMAGAVAHDKSFVAYWLGRLQKAFVDAPPEIFVAISTVFGILVVISFFGYPPRFPETSVRAGLGSSADPGSADRH